MKIDSLDIFLLFVFVLILIAMAGCAVTEEEAKQRCAWYAVSIPTQQQTMQELGCGTPAAVANAKRCAAMRIALTAAQTRAAQLGCSMEIEQ